MNVREISGSAAAIFGGVVGTASIGTLAEQIGAIVVLVAGMATAWYGSKQKVNMANVRGDVARALISAETWQTLAEGREATVEQRDGVIRDLQADKEALRAELASVRERVAALEALPRFDDVARLVERHHEENLKNFARVEDLLGHLAAAK